MISNLLSHISVSHKQVAAPLMGVLLLLGAVPVGAEVLHDVPCMQTAFGSTLNCTANDVDISNATNITILDDGCAFPGDTVEFSIDFNMILTTQNRYDIALYVAQDGDPNGDGVRTGICNLFSPPITPDPPYVDLDGDTPSQSCGDIDAAHSPMDVAGVILKATCIDDDHDGKLDLPFGTSWAQGADPDNCKGPLDAIPGTKAKCFLNPGGQIDINVPAIKLGIDKTGATPADVAPGDTYIYVITVTNEPASCSPACDEDATALTLTDQLDSRLKYVNSAVSGYSGGAGGTCTNVPDGNYGAEVICLWPAGTRLPVGESFIVQLEVLVNPALPPTKQIIPNEACIIGEGADQNPPIPVGDDPKICDDHDITTPVTLSYFHTNGSSFDWSTATETGNAGFNLYVETADGRQKINDELILSLVVDSSAPQDYHYTASGVKGNEFYIEDVGLFGQNRLHGPFKRGATQGKRIDPDPIDWVAISAENRSLKEQRAGARKAAAESRINRIKSAGNSGATKIHGKNASTAEADEPTLSTATTLSSANTFSSTVASADYAMVDLRVSEDGVYRVIYEDLLAVVGSTLDGAPMTGLALTNRGESVQIHVSSEGEFGPGIFFEFVGKSQDTLYTDINVYKLQVNEELAARVEIDTSRVPKKSVAPSYYMEELIVENNNAYNPLGANGDPWYDTRMLTSSSTTWSFNIVVDNIVTDAPEAAVLQMQMWGVTDQVDGDDHRVEVAFNGSVLSEELFDGLDVVNFSQALPEGALFDGENGLALTASKPDGVSFDMSILENYGVTYPRAFVARDGMLSFEGQAELFEVEGLGSTNVVAYRQRASGATTRISAKVQQGTATVRGGIAKATYYVAAESALLKPEIVLTQDVTDDIVSGPADMLIISHPNYLGGLAPLVIARETQGMSVKLVDVEDVYTNYSDSILDAGAIREYLKFAIEEMGVQYVLLVGGDTIDYRQYTGDSISFIPSLYAKTSEYFNFAAVDPLYVDINGDNLPDAAIGRFPVRSQAELNAMVAKTLQYGERDGEKTAVFAADTGFAYDADSFAARLPAGWSVQKTYIEVDGLDASRTALLTALNSGPALVSYVGHSGSTRWTFDPLFSNSDANKMTNEEPTVVTQWGCFNADYVDPAYDTMAHMFLLSSDTSGAAAVTGSTTVAFAGHERALGNLMMSRLVEPGKTIGTAMLEAKQELGSTDPEMLDVLLGWTLLGDPSVVIQPAEQP